MERVVLELIQAGRRRGNRVSVVCLERPGTLAGQVEALGGEVHCVSKPAGLRPGTVYRLARVFRALRPDVVHTHQLGALVYGGPAARWAGVPAVVHSEHGKHYAHSRRARWLGRFAMRYAHRVFGVTAEIVAARAGSGVAPRYKL